MVRVNPLIPAINAGEFSPRLVARADFNKYQNAAEVLRNMIPLTQGGASRRPGTRFVAEVKDSAAKGRLLRFQFNDQQAYVVEMGARAFRFFTQQGRIVVPATDAAISNGSFEDDVAGWAELSTGAANITHDSLGKTLQLNGAAASIAWTEQQVAFTTTGVLHVLAFEVKGAPGDKIQLRIGITTGGAEILADKDCETGNHIVAFTPGADFFVQFRHEAAKTIAIDNVALLNDQPLELRTPYETADLFALKRVQSNDVLYLSRGGVVPTYKLLRLGNESWSLVRVFFQDGPYLDQNIDPDKTLAASATTGNGITITASGHGPFKASDIGRLVRIQHAATEPGYGVITGFTSTTVVTVDVRRNFNAATASSKWNLGAWSETTGYPRYLTFFEQRLIGAGETVAPQTFSGSQSGDFENFRPDSFESGVKVEDDDGFRYTMAAEEANVIVWLAPAKNLLIGTIGGEWVARSDGPVITPSDIDVKGQTTHGSADVQPVRVSGVVMFAQTAGRKIRNLLFSFDSDSFQAPDLTILADHVTRSGIVEMAFQEEPDAVLWCLRNDGVLGALTYKPEQDVIGWGRIFLGGSFAGGHAVVESLAVIPGAAATGSQDRDEVWMTVKRTIGGQTRRSVEFLEAAYENPLRDDYADEIAWRAAILAVQQDAFYLDAGLSYDGAPVSALAGLDHLEGETVKVWSDGAIHQDRVVTNGQITLNQPAGKVAVGLPYLHRYKSLKLAFGAVAGTAIGKTKRDHAVTLVLDSVAEGSVMIGETAEAMEPLILREVIDAMDSAVPLFTGEYQVEIDGDWESDPRIIIEGDAPAPFTLLAIAPEMKTNDLK